MTLEAGEVKQALARLAQAIDVLLAPQEAARRLLDVAERSGWYQYDPRSHRLSPLGRSEYLQMEGSTVEAELTRNYLDWYDRRGTRGDCLRLLVESLIVPNPSKGIAAVMTAALIAWIGLDTFWSP